MVSVKIHLQIPKDCFGFEEKLDLFLTREKSGASYSGFSEKDSTSLSFPIKSLMSFSISGKSPCGINVNFTPLLKI